MRYFWIFLFLLSSYTLCAQDIYTLTQFPEIEVDGEILSAPFAGGINSAQIQLIDLTGDGEEEWVIWDINTRQLLVFKNNKEVVTHLPEMSYLFPQDISGFLILEDYDGDGKKDLFTATALGIKVYKNTSTANQVSWSVAQSFLKLDGSANIQVNNLDRPLFKDIDGDGDLDLITFNFAAGDYLEVYKNTSMERKGKADVDGFAFPEVFWGDFIFCGCAEFSFGETCTGKPFSRESFEIEDKRIQHTGGHSILYEDFSGDGISDLVVGRDECNVLYYLQNHGTESEPKFTEYSNDLPGFGSLPEFPIFHVGQKIGNEMLVSLNTNDAAYNYGVDFSNSIVKLSKNGDVEFGFLQNQILDLGENARVSFQGNKNSGELLATTNTTVNGIVRSETTKFQLTPEKLILQERDYLGLSSLNLLDAQVLKINSKADKQFTLISGIQHVGTLPKQLLFSYENGIYAPFSLNGYEPKRGDYLQFFDYKNVYHLLVAAQNGSLNLYQVDMDTNSATLLESDFLGFVDNPANRNLTVAVLQGDQPDLYAIDQSGKIWKIEDFMKKNSREEALVKIGIQNYPTRLGRKTWIAVLPPLFNENPDLLLGTGAGGFIYLSPETSDLPPSEEYLIKIFPNPSVGPIQVIVNKESTGTLINSLGQELLSDIKIPANTQLEIQAGFLSPGLYIFLLEAEGKFRETRKIWMR